MSVYSLMMKLISALFSLPPKLNRYDVKKLDVDSYSKLLSSVVQALVLEPKSLPIHLKCAYLGEDETLSVIISNTLTSV